MGEDEQEKTKKNCKRLKIKKMKNPTFYMVYLEDGGAPTFRHSTLLLAELEAKRLAKKHDKKAFVLCSIKSFEINEFLEKDYRPETDDLPF